MRHEWADVAPTQAVAPILVVCIVIVVVIAAGLIALFIHLRRRRK